MDAQHSYSRSSTCVPECKEATYQQYPSWCPLSTEASSPAYWTRNRDPGASNRRPHKVPRVLDAAFSAAFRPNHERILQYGGTDVQNAVAEGLGVEVIDQVHVHI